MIGFMFIPEEMNDLASTPGSEEIPLFIRFMVSNIRYFFLSILVLSATTLASSIGLLKRKNWGRIIFIVIMSLGIAWIVFGVFMQFTMFPDMSGEMSDMMEASKMKMMFTIMRIFMVVFSAAFCVLFGWIIKKLMSPSIKQEFQTN
jgi:hypothetical protein